MNIAVRVRARRALIGCLLVGALAAGVSACSTDLTVFGGNQRTLTGAIVVQRTTVHGGRLVRAELVLHNISGHPIVLFRGCSFQFLDLVLARGTVTNRAIFLTPLCRPGVTFVAHPGTTIYHLATAAGYNTCSPSGVPRCPGRRGRMPALPSGGYTVTVRASSVRLQHELAHVRSGWVQIIH